MRLRAAARPEWTETGMRRILIAIGVVMVLLLGAIVAIPRLIPADTLKAEVEGQVRTATGRDFAIAGPVSLSVFPSVSLTVEDVTLGNAPGAAQERMVGLKRLDLSLKLLPLLSKQVEVDSFVVVDPVIHLEVDNTGKPNWVFETTASPPGQSGGQGADSAGSATSGSATSGSGGGQSGTGASAQPLTLPDIRLGDVRLENGTVTYLDRRTGMRQEISGINASISLPDMQSPFALDGDLVWNGEAVALDAETGPLAALVSGAETPVELTIRAAPVALSFTGRVANDPSASGPKAVGEFTLDIPSVRRVARWVDVAIPDDFAGQPDIGPIKVSGSGGTTESLSVDGSVVFNAETIKLALQTGNLNALLAGDRSPMKIDVTSAPVTFAYDGTVVNKSTLLADGQITLDVPSLRGLAAFAGSPLPDDLAAGGLGPFSVKGQLAAQSGPRGQKVSFTNAEIALDAIKGQGALSADTTGKRPAITARLDVDTLDLNPYMPPQAAPSQAATPSGQGSSQEAGSGGGQGTASAAGWSEEPIDASALGMLDADLSFSANQLLVQKIKVGRSAVRVQLADSRLSVDLSELNLYGGQGKGLVSLDARKPVLAVEKQFTLVGVQAFPLLSDAAEFDRLEGTADFSMAMTTRGRSQMDMVKALNGQGAFTFLDGAIVGINLAQMVRNVTTAFTASGERQKTDFAELSGTFTVKNGLLSNNDLSLIAPLVRVGGAGTTDMPTRTINYRIEPRAVASIQGQGGASDLAGVTVPIIVEGTWDKPSYRPDLAALITGGAGKAIKDIVKDPGKVLDSVTQNPRSAIGDIKTNPAGALQNLLGGGQAAPTPEGQAAPESEQPQQQPVEPGKLLRGLFGN